MGFLHDILDKCAHQSGRLLQDGFPEVGKPELLMTVSGQDLIGIPLSVRCSLSVHWRLSSSHPWLAVWS